MCFLALHKWKIRTTVHDSDWKFGDYFGNRWKEDVLLSYEVCSRCGKERVRVRDSYGIKTVDSVLAHSIITRFGWSPHINYSPQVSYREEKA